jgi:dihydroorotase
MKLLIQNGRVIDPSQKLDAIKDILIEDGKVKAIDQPGAFAAVKFDSAAGDKIFDAKDCIVAPGFIDVHVHLREPGLEYKETIASGTLAALHGGFTSVSAMANTKPVNDNALVTKYILEKAREADHARVFPIGAVSKGMKGEELAEIGMMVEAGARAISDDGLPVMNSYLMRKAMEYARTFDVPIISHAEDLNLSQAGHTAGAPMNEGAVSSLLGYRGNPNASEEIMVSREIALARLTGAKVHIAHLSTKEAIEQVKRAKEAGLSVTAEVTPHHLMLNDQFILSGKHTCVHHQSRTDYKMAPPLRSEADQAALLEALNRGVIDMIGSDHAPHGCVDKEVEFELAANGILGLQTTVPLMLDLVHANQLSLLRMIESLTVAPAKLLQLHGMGTLKPGSFGDVTILELKKDWTLTPALVASKSKNSPFLGRKFKGAVRATIVAGQVKYEAPR